MTWVTLDEQNGKIVLVSTRDNDGIIHKGSYLTIEDNHGEESKKFILRVEDTYQNVPYKPSSLLVDMDLESLLPDQKCQNIVYASRIIEHPPRNDGKSSFIRPNMKARKSNQEEIDIAFGNKEGIPVFPATVFARSCQNLVDENGNYLHVKIPEDVFFHQMLITGKTGSGKTVAMKYLSQYFVDNFDNGRGGAVLAVNVKEEDMLTLNKPSYTTNKQLLKEWRDLGLKPKGIETFRIYVPGDQPIRYSNAVDLNQCEYITLKTSNIDPETMVGLIQNISSLGADQLPAIFRYWQQKIMHDGDTIADFISYFSQNGVRTLWALAQR